MKQYIGVEIGGTKQQIASFSEDGTLLRRISEKIALPNGAVDILNWMKANVPSLVCEDTAGIGVGFGGIVDTSDGSSACSVHVPGWEKFPIKKWFSETFGLPVTVVNDTVCGGYAELLCGAGKGYDRFFYTNIGTGCGGGFFLHGINYNGGTLGSSYFGQSYVPAWDGKIGDMIRLEKICCGPSIEARLHTPGYIPESSLLRSMKGGDISKLKCPDWCEAARQGDAFALADIDKWASRYAHCLSTFITLFAVERVAIGGGVSNNGDILLDPIRRYCKELAFVSVENKFDIVQCETKDDAVLIGSAMYARDGFRTL